MRAKKALVEGDMTLVLSLINEGIETKSTWEELYTVLDLRRKLSETENKRVDRERQYLMPEEFHVAAAYLGSLARKYVTDIAVLRLFQRDMAKFFEAGWGPGGPGLQESGGEVKRVGSGGSGVRSGVRGPESGVTPDPHDTGGVVDGELVESRDPPASPVPGEGAELADLASRASGERAGPVDET